LRHTAQSRVVAQCVTDEIGELRERFDPRVARADEHEGQLSFGVTGRSELEPPQDVIALADRILE
jgi:hypothetical protein